MTKILVTGATGFVGKHLVTALVKEKEEVFCLVRDTKIKDPLFQKVKLIKGKMEDNKTLLHALKDIDIVYHLAAISGKSAISPKLYQSVNIEGVRNLVSAALKEKVKRFIFISSNAVTGSLEKLPGNENSPYNPTNWYEKSKVAGEIIVNEAINKFQLPAVIIRPGSIYGPGNDNSNMAKFIGMGVKGLGIIPGTGENYWDLVYIDDCVKGLLLAGKVHKAIGQTFILTGPCPVKVIDILKLSAKAADKNLHLLQLPILPLKMISKFFTFIENQYFIAMPFSEKTIQILTENRYHSFEKAKLILGYKPEVTLALGMRKIIKYKKKNLAYHKKNEDQLDNYI